MSNAEENPMAVKFQDETPPAPERKILNRDDIIRARDIQKEYVDMHLWGWGGGVFVQGMTGAQRAQYEYEMGAVVGPDRETNWRQFRARILVHCVVDENGVRLFRAQDIDALNEKNAGALDHLCEVAQRLSGFRRKDVEEIISNLKSGQSDAST